MVLILIAFVTYIIENVAKLRFDAFSSLFDFSCALSNMPVQHVHLQKVTMWSFVDVSTVEAKVEKKLPNSTWLMLS